MLGFTSLCCTIYLLSTLPVIFVKRRWALEAAAGKEEGSGMRGGHDVYTRFHRYLLIQFIHYAAPCCLKVSVSLSFFFNFDFLTLSLSTFPCFVSFSLLSFPVVSPSLVYTVV